MWKCTVCLYIHDGDNPPEKCPRCKAPAEKFEELVGEKKDKVVNSRITNDLHMELNAIMDQVIALGEEGIEIDLDPGCVAVFKRTVESAEYIKQAIKAEIEGHVNKGKWG
jgi:hypothetical protein